MYRQKFQKHGIISTGLLMSIFFWNAGILRADTPEAPLLPMNVEFRYVPQYLDESIPDDPRYARIQALLDEDGCHVILLDKTTDREAFYSTSKRRVDALAANGSDAYITPVDFTASLPKDASPSFLIHFQDRFGNEVSWKFVVGRIVPHASPEVISRTDNSGIIFLYAPRRAPSADGTSLRIAGREYLPKSTQSADALATFYATDMTLGQIMPGTELWAVERSPSDMTKTASWNAAGDGGRRRTLAVKELSATEASIEQFDVNDPNAPHIILNLVRVNDAWELRSLSFGSHFNTLRIFFGPQLPLPARQTDDRRIVVTFTVSMVAPARFGGSLSSWPSVRGPRSSKPTSLTWTRSSDALVFTPEIKIASPRYGSNHTHSDAYSRPALNSWSERKLCLSLCSAA